eukprot:2584043-Rhodomonas_salina.6
MTEEGVYGTLQVSFLPPYALATPCPVLITDIAYAGLRRDQSCTQGATPPLSAYALAMRCP